MKREEKDCLIKYLSDEFSKSCAIVICDYRHMNSEEIFKLRELSRMSNFKVMVVKNTLAKISFERAEIKGLTIKNTNIFIWGVDPIVIAKAIVGFSKQNDKLLIKAGYIENSAVSAEKVKEYSKVASKEETIATLLYTLNAPIRNFLYILNAKTRQLITVLKEIEKTKK